MDKDKSKKDENSDEEKKDKKETKRKERKEVDPIWTWTQQQNLRLYQTSV